MSNNYQSIPYDADAYDADAYDSDSDAYDSDDEAPLNNPPEPPLYLNQKTNPLELPLDSQESQTNSNNDDVNNRVHIYSNHVTKKMYVSYILFITLLIVYLVYLIMLADYLKSIKWETGWYDTLSSYKDYRECSKIQGNWLKVFLWISFVLTHIMVSIIGFLIVYSIWKIYKKEFSFQKILKYIANLSEISTCTKILLGFFVVLLIVYQWFLISTLSKLSKCDDYHQREKFRKLAFVMEIIIPIVYTIIIMYSILK
jgi:hypothetical protein